MADLFGKLIILTLIYGGVTLLSGKNALGDLVRFSCALGMLVFLTGKINDIAWVDKWTLNDIDIIEQNAELGEQMFKAGFNKQIEEYIEKDIEAICRKYGADGEVKISLTIENRQAAPERIELTGDFESLQGIGFIKNEISDKYNVDEVIIIENKY